MTIRNETVHVAGKVLYCDVCGARGPECVLDYVEDLCDLAEKAGWRLDDCEGVEDLCQSCAAKRVQ